MTKVQEFQTRYHMKIAQSWEQLSIFVERESEVAGHVRVHSDMASIRVGMMKELAALRFVYTFEEYISRREGFGIMAQQFSGAATFEFRRNANVWLVEEHFFNDSGRSGQVELRQVTTGIIPDGSMNSDESASLNTKTD